MASGPSEPSPPQQQSLPGSSPASTRQPLPTAPPPPAVVVDPSLGYKLTRGHSCVTCQKRKVRCDKQKPCGNCVKAGLERECRVIPPQPPRRRKRHRPLQEHDLLERLRRYETLMRQHGVKFDPLPADAMLAPFSVPSAKDNVRIRQRSSTAEDDDVENLQKDLVALQTSPSSSQQEITAHPGDSRAGTWYPYDKDRTADDAFSEESSEEDVQGATIHHAFDKMFNDDNGFPFSVDGGTASVTASHPPAIQIIQLWQVYLTNVDPLFKITHIPTLQGQVVEASTAVANLSKPLEALMFSIYLIAITSMPPDEVMAAFDEEKPRLIAHFHRATQQALVNAGFMRNADLMVLQAYFFYLICVRGQVDPRTVFCLIGIAIRMAQRLGLHRDGEQFGMPPFEVDMRRRMWWQLVAFDRRMAEITGSTVTALTSFMCDTRFPLNINDTDLHITAKEPPVSYAGATEMLFSLTRFEICTAGGTGTALTLHGGNNGGPAAGHSGFMTWAATAKKTPKFSSSPAIPDVVSHAVNTTIPRDIDTYCAYIEAIYLNHCDPKVPVQYFAILMTRQALCKMRIIEFLSRNNLRNSGQRGSASNSPGRFGATPGASPKSQSDLDSKNAERDALFAEAVRMVEYDNLVHQTNVLRGFIWFMQMHFPFPGYMFLASELRTRVTGEAVDQAWSAICENQNRRMRAGAPPKSPVFIALGGMFIKAWEAREAAERLQGRILNVPEFVQKLRAMFHKQKPNPGPAPGMGIDGRIAPPTQYIGINSNMAYGGPSLPVTDPGAQQPQPQMAYDPNPQVAGVFPTFDNSAMYGGANVMQQLDFGQMDWNYVLQEYSHPANFGPGGFS